MQPMSFPLCFCRIQNLNFGSPNYLTGVNTTTPYFQMGNTMQTYNPQGFNQTTPGDTSSYLGYTPQPYVPTNPQFAQPAPFATPATQGGGGGGSGWGIAHRAVVLGAARRAICGESADLSCAGERLVGFRQPLFAALQCRAQGCSREVLG